MATGDKLVNLDELKLVYDKLHVPSVQVQIPTGQWSGSSTRTYTVNATGVTTDTIIDWAMDSSINYLTSELTVTPGSGTLTFSTPTLPAGTINVTLFFPGVNGEVVIQTLADVYSKSQVDTLLAAKVSTSNIINNLTSTATNQPLSANMGKTLEEHIQQSTAGEAWVTTSPISSNFTSGEIKYKKIGNVVYITAYSMNTTKTGSIEICTMPSGYITAQRWTVKPSYPLLSGDSYININSNGLIQFINQTGGAVNNLYFTAVYPTV